MIWVGRDSKCFSKQDWTAHITLIGFNKFNIWRDRGRPQNKAAQARASASLRNIPSRSNDVTTRSDPDALFQGAIEALGEFGKPEILDRAKALAA